MLIFFYLSCIKNLAAAYYIITNVRYNLASVMDV